MDIGKVGGSILTSSLNLLFLNLPSCNYTLPPLVKRRNRGVIFCFYTLYTLFPVNSGENPRPVCLLISLLTGQFFAEQIYGDDWDGLCACHVLAFVWSIPVIVLFGIGLCCRNCREDNTAFMIGLMICLGIQGELCGVIQKSLFMGL